MPNLAPPSMLSLSSMLPGDLSKTLQGAFRAHDSYAQSIAQQLSEALVVGDTVRVFQPYTAANPLQIPTDLVTLTLGGGWTSVTTPKYSTDSSGWVQVVGTATGGSLSTDIVTGLPAPTAARSMATVANDAFGKLVLTTGGALQITAGSTTNVDLYISYRSATGAPYVPSCFPVDLLWPLANPPTLVVAQCQDVTNSQSPSNLALFLPDWVMVPRASGALLRIRNIPGLLASTKYTTTLVAF